ncbi:MULTISPECIES: tyrosine-type recombinase/integrase [Thermoanaerobacterium]|uniref:Integrase family protein n=2 Tax=Thermoanaerobacterium TaxID=28895 RepID=W9EEI1_9THEO|nr:MULTISPECIES: tyrosine-type recombinase/integrase [Thermoanaerobacterium]AFK85168.1 integrase family protein [Thermoanaerobacterium saccharolyticum JW/SL-YS485]ETO39656.1 integrase family protein [Thermoanaerobacterium aotearoense SCUT27]
MTVEPIRDKVKIKQMYYYLQGKDPKYGLLFKFGLNTGLRISDILPIKVNDIYTSNYKFREYLTIKEKKTEKEKKIKINESLKKEIDKYIKLRCLKYDDYLFPSNKGGHIGRIQSYRILKEAAETVGVENFGTHSLRKTWGYWSYKTSRYNIGLIMDTFNHSSQKITLRYIGVNQEQKDELYTLVQF